MSEQVQAIVEAVRCLDPTERRELTAALAAIELSPSDVSTSRRQMIESIRGKYRYIPTSSESFISRKAEDPLRESSL